jgi:hypothetical protein
MGGTNGADVDAGEHELDFLPRAYPEGDAIGDADDEATGVAMVGSLANAAPRAVNRARIATMPEDSARTIAFRFGRGRKTCSFEWAPHSRGSAPNPDRGPN